MAMLEVKDLEVYYGMIQAIKGISFEVNQGEVIALIGANGAGKTTTLQTITGMLQAKKGHILFEGQDITKVPGHKIVTMGMAHVPEGRRVFANLSVYENLKLGAYTRKDKDVYKRQLTSQSGQSEQERLLQQSRLRKFVQRFVNVSQKSMMMQLLQQSVFSMVEV